MALVAILSFVPAHVFSSPVVKGVAIGITQSFQFFGLHTFCPQNIWPQTPVIHSYRCYLLFIIFVPNLKVHQLEYAIARDG